MAGLNGSSFDALGGSCLRGSGQAEDLTMSHDVRSELTNNDFTRRPVEPPPMSR